MRRGRVGATPQANCWSSPPVYSGCTTGCTLAIGTAVYLLVLVAGFAVVAWPAIRSRRPA